MIGYRKIIRIMTVVVFVYFVLNLLVLRDTPYPVLKQILNIVFILTAFVLFLLLLLNRYRP
ncbi:MAG TPA: hypothetical protein PLY40_00360 [Bacillota bacterium]|nr:hypothetical protein [Bacillota bacterium]